MTEYRFARPGEEEEILDFIDLVFSQQGAPHDFAKLLPKVYAHPGFAPLHAVAVQEGRIRAVIGMLPVALRYRDGGLLQGGGIGSVSVHGRSRGEGHMKALMRMQIEEARRRSYDFLVLGGQRQRYGYFGFEKGGTELAFFLNGANLRHALGEADADKVRFRPLEDPNDPALPGVAALQESQPCYCQRDPALLLDILRSYGSVPYAVEDGETGALAGYLSALDGDVTELMLTDESLCAPVLKRWGAAHPSFSVRVWDGQEQRAAYLRTVAENYSIRDGEMFLILNWPRVLAAALRFQCACRPLPEGRRVFAIGDDSPLCLQVKEGKPSVFLTDETPDRTLTDKEAFSLLFSPLSALTADDPLLRAWLPLPLSLLIADQF